tara:strand:+ start:130 stop:465 length:336 start_codon:yes stop_codon:yes gene_type:complete
MAAFIGPWRSAGYKPFLMALHWYNARLSTRANRMPTSFLEIVEMPDGRIVLRRAEDEEVLVTLDFSEEARLFLQGQHVEVAKAMFNVGVQMAGKMAEGDFEYEDESPRVLH